MEIKNTHFKISEEEVKAIFNLLNTHQKEYKSRFLIHYKEQLKTVLASTIDSIYLENRSVYFKLVDQSLIHLKNSMNS